MITARINNQLLNLPLDFTFEIVRNSQLTSFDKLKGDYVPSISFPDTERNRTILFNPQLFEMKREGVKEYPDFELDCNGYGIRGTLVLSNGLEGFVKGTAGFLAAANADKLITDYTLPQNQTFSNKSSYNPDTDDYCAPELTNPDFFRELTKTRSFTLPDQNTEIEQTVLQSYHRAAEYAVNKKQANGTVDVPSGYLSMFPPLLPQTSETVVVTPSLFLFRAVKELLVQNNFYIATNELDAIPDFKKLAIYNNFNIVKYQPQQATNLDVTYYDGSIVGYIDPTMQILQFPGTFNYADLLPPVTLKSFLLGLQNLVNIVFVFTDAGTVNIIDRENVLEKTPVDLDPYFTGTWEMSEKKNVVLEFVMSHDEKDGYFGDRYKDLSEREADFGPDVATRAALDNIVNPELGELRRVTYTNEIYEYKMGTVLDEYGNEYDMLGWFFASTDYQNYKYNYNPSVDKEVEKIETSFSTLLSGVAAYTNQLGRCNLRRGDEAAFTPRLIFNENGTARNRTSNYLLNWRGTNNLIETRWQKWARFWANREPVTGFFQIPGHRLQNLDINSPQSTRHGSFIINRMVTRVSHNGIGESKLEVYKL